MSLCFLVRRLLKRFICNWLSFIKLDSGTICDLCVSTVCFCENGHLAEIPSYLAGENWQNEISERKGCGAPSNCSASTRVKLLVSKWWSLRGHSSKLFIRGDRVTKMSLVPTWMMIFLMPRWFRIIFWAESQTLMLGTFQSLLLTSLIRKSPETSSDDDIYSASIRHVLGINVSMLHNIFFRRALR